MIWGIAKQYYNRNIGRDGKTQTDCLNMWSEALRTITPQIWANSIRHTEKEILKWYDREHIMDRIEIDPIIISPNRDDSDWSTDESS